MNEDRIVLSGKMESSRTKFRHVNINIESDKKMFLKRIKKLLKKVK